MGSCVFFNRGSILLIKFICIERRRYLLHYQTKDDLEKHIFKAENCEDDFKRKGVEKSLGI